ncbi:hypothetical protein DFH08DRAFT_819178 [Mycena albidolilacea]|uniref:Uncharacterized protein n=1 Tax=Mycena albidolilacea TaxID=1033008 RepID=A0AAD6ZF13_9AGAR|nr:hypothetical protein DFH08DRAFT_819178 [Mycena albidolilacea]
MEFYAGRQQVWVGRPDIGCTGETGSGRIGPEVSCMRGIESGWEIGDVLCRREVWVKGVNTRWKVFTGDVLTVEHSLHWSQRRWWFGCKEMIFSHVYVRNKEPAREPVYRKFRAPKRASRPVIIARVPLESSGGVGLATAGGNCG